MSLRTPNPILVAVALASATAACGSSSDGGIEAENVLERRQLLSSVTDNVIGPAYQRFADSTSELAQAIEAYAQAVGTTNETSAREAAMSAFGAAYEAMQYAELLQIGPYGRATSFAGGRGIRDEVYSWPTSVNPCQVDVKLVERKYEEASFFDTSLVNVYGFDALEYLLMNREPGNACAAPVSINEDGTWDTLGAEEIEARRADYAARIAREIATEAAALQAAWTNDFADQLRNAGESVSVYRTAQAGLDDLFASMFYLELEVKDKKLAGPLGISADCRAQTCPDLLESQFAGLSVTAIEANILAFRDIYFGGPPSSSNRFGFGELLRASNASQLADDLDASMALAISSAALVEDPVVDILETEPPRALHDAVRAVTTILKSQFPSVLSLRVPNEGAADND